MNELRIPSPLDVWQVFDEPADAVTVHGGEFPPETLLFQIPDLPLAGELHQLTGRDLARHDALRIPQAARAVVEFDATAHATSEKWKPGGKSEKLSAFQLHSESAPVRFVVCRFPAGLGSQTGPGGRCKAEITVGAPDHIHDFALALEEWIDVQHSGLLIRDQVTPSSNLCRDLVVVGFELGEFSKRHPVRFAKKIHAFGELDQLVVMDHRLLVARNDRWNGRSALPGLRLAPIGPVARVSSEFDNLGWLLGWPALSHKICFQALTIKLDLSHFQQFPPRIVMPHHVNLAYEHRLGNLALSAYSARRVTSSISSTIEDVAGWNGIGA